MEFSYIPALQELQQNTDKVEPIIEIKKNEPQIPEESLKFEQISVTTHQIEIPKLEEIQIPVQSIPIIETKIESQPQETKSIPTPTAKKPPKKLPSVST